MGLYSQDAYRNITLITIGFGLLVELWFFFTLGIQNSVYISDGLEHTFWYRVGLTAYIITLLSECVVYFWFKRQNYPWLSTLGTGIAGGAIKSWLILLVMTTTEYPTIHMIATLAFLTNTTLYVCILIYMECTHAKQSSLYVYLSFATSFVLTLTYTVLWAEGNSAAWVLEHISFIVLNASLAFYFFSHPFIECNDYMLTECIMA